MPAANENYRLHADQIVEFLLYSWDKRFVTAEVLRDELGLSRVDQSNATRWIISAWDERVLRYHDGLGTYEVVDLEAYFDPPPPGAAERWTRRFIR